MSKKMLKTYEKERNLIFLGDVDLDRKYSEDEIADLMDNPDFPWVGINHEDRTAFLKENGYEVTRENMIDSTLSVKPQNSENTDSADEQNEVG